MVFGLVFLLFSCNSEDKKSTTGVEISTSDANKQMSCFENFETSYDKLLSKDDINSVYTLPKNGIEEDVENRKLGHYRLKWQSDRPVKKVVMGGIAVHESDNNMIEVSGLALYKKGDLGTIKKQFDQGHKDMERGSLEKAKEVLDDANIPDDAKELGKDILASQTDVKFDQIEGLGSSAWYRWTQDGGNLTVLSGRTKFDLKIKISTDREENKEVAKKLAAVILGKCD